MSDSYARRGVSAGKADVHFAIRNLDKGLYPRAFCKILPDLLTGDEAYCTIMHADGAGTKSSLAYLYWKETGDLSVWRGIAQDGIVMNLDDMLCAGAVGPFMFSNTIGRNAFHVGREVLAEVLNGMEDVFDMLREFGIEAVNTGGETADVGDLVQTMVYDALLSHACHARRSSPMRRYKQTMSSWDWPAMAQATYEKEYNSGIGSNGLTNGRHDTLANIYAAKYPESYDQVNVPADLVYSGPHKLTDPVEGTPLDVGKLLLSPTRTFLPVMKPILEEHRDKIHGLIHCTGGGQTKVMKFVKNLHVIKDNLLPTPPVFKLIQAASEPSGKKCTKSLTWDIA